MAKTVNISFQKDLLSDIDKLAKDERRTRSELVREAARMYIERKKRWNRVFSLGRTAVRQHEIKTDDVAAEIQGFRKAKAGLK